MKKYIEQLDTLPFSRPINFCKQIVILDGISGTGKTMFTPILSSFKRVQNARFEYMIEYLCICAQKLKMSPDAAHTLLNLLADLKCYDGMISREVNFRPNDLSSVFKSNKTLKYFKQLWMNDGQAIEARIQNENPILCLTTHQLMSCLNPAFDSYKDRLRVIETVRHPLYLLDHWVTYIEMFGNNVRDFTVWCEYEGESIPWFAEGWEDDYLHATIYDRVIYTIEHLMKKVFSMAISKEKADQLLFIPFEKFVLEPDPYIKELEKHISTERSSSTNKILKKQRVPRGNINAGPQKSIYKRYGVKKQDRTIPHAQDYEMRYNSAKQKSSASAFDVIEKISKKYEEVFGLWY